MRPRRANNGALAIYLHDHLAGAQFAVELLANLQAKHTGEDLGDFAATLLIDVEQDVLVLERVIARVGESPSMPVKRTMTWLAEKASRVKLRREATNGLGSVQALETLSLGILGKWALWQALAAVASANPYLAGEDYARLSQRAQEQHAAVEGRRLRAAQEVFH